MLSSFLPRLSPAEDPCFQYMSDLHLEVGQQYDDFHVAPRATYLILAGDIGRLVDYERFRKFLERQCQLFRQVFLVLGNHEFFGSSRAEGVQLAEQLEAEGGLKGKLIILNRRRVDVASDVILLGCTLQSYIPQEAEGIVRSKINDFRHIKEWTVANHVTEHEKDVEWLKQEIADTRRKDASRKKKILVVTHHAPSTKGTSKPSDEANPWSSAFATDLLQTNTHSALDDVQCWIYGHTHYCMRGTRGKVKLVSNQRGYVFPNAKVSETSTKAGIASQMRAFLDPKKPLAFDSQATLRI